MDPYFENTINHRQSIIDAFSPAECYDNFFSKDEIEQLVLYQFQNSQRIKWTASSNNIQPVVDIDTMFESLPWLDDKFSDILDDYFEKHTGNFYITTQLHDCHVDLLTDEETETFDWIHQVIPYKSVVIPLMISSNDAHTVFFDQRHIGHSVTLDRSYSSQQDNSMYKIARDYPTFYDVNGVECDTNAELDFENYLFPHLDSETLRGLTVENAFNFQVGDAMVFDSCQVHCSATTREKPNYRWMKSGINIQFYKEV